MTGFLTRSLNVNLITVYLMTRCRFQVFESFIHLGPGSITPTNIYRSFLKFSIVAGGGTIIGLLFGYLGSFIFRGKWMHECFPKSNTQISDWLVAKTLSQKSILTFIVRSGWKLQNNDRLIKPLNDLSIIW